MSLYEAAADKLGFAVVAPRGIQHSWNAPHCCGAAKENGVDDVGFIDSLVAHLLQSSRFDATALFATGFSNGGFLASILARQSTLFRKVFSLI